MLKTRKLLISALVLLIGGGLASVLLYRHIEEAPQVVLLLPDGDMLGYVNLEPLHLTSFFKSAVQPDSEYQAFLKETGIQLERDVDEAAISCRQVCNSDNMESAEVFSARFDSQRLMNFLKRLATGTEQYSGLTIYLIPNEGHMVRVCVLNAHLVAVTNMASSTPMHTIISRAQGGGGEPVLAAGYYKKVPVASLAWVLYSVSGKPGAAQLPGGYSLGALENATAVISARYNGSLLLRADVFTQNEEDAKQLVNSADTFITMYKNIGESMGTRGTDPDVKAAFDSVHVEQKDNLARLEATVPPKFLQKLVEEGK